MCISITAVLPPEADVAALHALARTFGRNMMAIENQSVRRSLRIGERYCLTTTGHCDCHTALGHLARSDSARRHPSASKSRERARRGWSPAKLERARAQSERVRQRESLAEDRWRDADIENWREFVTAVHAAGVPYIGLLLHMYHAPVQGDLVQLQGRIVVEREEIERTLRSMTEDTLYEFRSGARP